MNAIADPPPLSGERLAILISEVLQWVNTRTDARPVPELWVPGATLDELIQLGALGEVVAAVISDDGTLPAAFSTGNLRRWIDSGHRPEPAVVAAFRALLAKDGEQHLAAIYSAVVSGPSRRTLGTFFTPADEADWMVRTWGARFTPPKSVVDVGAGVGIFSLRATDAWPHAEVFAVDINPVTLGLLALCTHEAGQEGRSAAGRVIPVEADFTVWIDTVWNLVPGPRLILGNPPYTRLQLMPATDRKRLTKAAGGKVGSRAALSAVITAQSLLALEPADGLALLLPAQWLEADYAVDLRAHLWKQTHRRVELRVFEEQLFADATVDAVALLVGPQEATAQPLTVSRTGGTHEVPSRDADDVGGFDRIVALARERTTLPPPTAWAPLDTFLRVRRGVATGANRFFILDADAVDDLQLSAELLTPMLRRTRSAPDTLTEASFQNLPDIDRRWLLTVHAEQVLTSPALRAYIDRGEKDGMDEGLLCRLRADWFDLHHDLLIPDLIIGQSSKHGFRVVENDLRAAIANNLYGMRWASTTTAAQREAIVEWLRGEGGQSALRAAARVQATGLLKIEPRALAQLPVPQAVWEVAGDDVGVGDPLR